MTSISRSNVVARLALLAKCAFIGAMLGAPLSGHATTTGSTLTVIKSGSGSGTVTGNVGAIDCGATCSASYADNTIITLSATPSGGSQFTGWLGRCTGTGTCSFTINGATTAFATFAAAPLTGPALDIDGGGNCDALTDGLLAIRYLLGLSGAALIDGAVGAGATRATGAQVGNYLQDIRPLLDIDGNGQVDALTDGLLVIRYLFGLTGPSLISGALGSGAIRDTPMAIETQMQSLCTPPPAPPCANLPPGNVGCEFYAVPLSNSLLDRSTFTFAVALYNTGASTAAVTISGGALGSPIAQDIAPGSQITVALPWVTALQNTTATVLQANGAYRIVSDRPLAAYQYNPLQYTAGGMDSYTNDASLLLPVATLTGNYRVVAWPSWNAQPGMFAIVATVDATQVTVTPNGNIVVGGGLPAAGGTVTLDRGDVLQIAMPTPGTVSYGSDPSGSLIAAAMPVAVFGAHDATWIPSNSGFADHLEEQLPPLETLGTDHLVPRLLTQAGSSRKQFVKVVATQDGTSLLYDPAAPGRPATLNAGQVATFEATSSFRLTADRPVLAARYMEGGEQFSDGGDPAMGIVVPFSQFRDAYALVAPTNYETNRLTVVAPTGATVTLDGSPIAVGSFTAVGGSGYSVADVVLSNAGSGVHTIAGTAPVGITVYGYGQNTSYLYPGGMNLARSTGH